MTEVFNGTDKNKLKLYVAKIESLEADKVQVNDNIKEVFKEVASDGFDVKTVRQILRLRKMKEDSRREAEELLDLYKTALDMD